MTTPDDTVRNHAPYDKPVWGSDVMVDALRQLDLPYIALNPGSSFRGLHDSLVNYAGDEMQMIECPHEKIAVALAHGYAKASGKPMGVILHDLVGLLQGTMGVYYAYIDRVPGADPRRVRAGRPEPPSALHRLDPLGERPGPGGPRVHQVGPRAPLHRVGARRARPRLPGRDHRPAGAHVRRPGRRAAGGQARRAGVRGPRGGAGRRAVAGRPRPRGAARAGPGAVRGPPSGDGARLPGSRPAVLPHPGGAGRAGRDRRGGHPLAVELPEQAPAVRQRHRRRRRRRLRPVRRRQGHGQAEPPHRPAGPPQRLAPRRGLPGALARLRRHGHLVLERGLRADHPGAPHRRRRHRGRPAAAAGGVPADPRRRGPAAAPPSARRGRPS